MPGALRMEGERRHGRRRSREDILMRAEADRSLQRPSGRPVAVARVLVRPIR